MSSITKKEVEYISGLARIRLTEDEKDKLAKELGGILGYIDKLNEINTDGVQPIAQVTGLVNVLREDEPGEVDPDVRKRLLEQAPGTKDEFVKVKSVFTDR